MSSRISYADGTGGTVQSVRQWVEDLNTRLAELFYGGTDVADLLHFRSATIESVIAQIWSEIIGEQPDIALFAVGGFGRRELFPHSDIDLLILRREKSNQILSRSIETFVSCLWDIGLKPAQAVHTIAQCRQSAQSDISLMTALLNVQFIAGSVSMNQALSTLLEDAELWPPKVYFETRRDDQEKVYKRFNDTAYNLEPNIKEGIGGVKSLQLIQWLGKRVYRASTFSELREKNIISVEEKLLLENAQAVLWRTRYALHLLTNRPEERLLFDYQVEIAQKLGFDCTDAPTRGVERFMQTYFRATKIVERINEYVLQRIEEFLEDSSQSTIERLSLDFININGRLEADDPKLFLRRPEALIDMFRIWQDNPKIKTISPSLMQKISLALQHHAENFAFAGKVNKAFLRLLHRGGRAVQALTEMNRLGVLGAYLPAFAKVSGQMQFDLSHVYTVDEHTIRVLQFIAYFASDQGKKEFPIAHEVQRHLIKPDILLLAVLFHDIAKGRSGDHSELGEIEVREFGKRAGLSFIDTESVAWLVRWHLLMSMTAQHQDITDRDVIHTFAKQVATWERLDMLYLLTVADIAGTNPKLWNSWKSLLLSDLYSAARYALRQGLEYLPHANERVKECQRQALRLLHPQHFRDDQIRAVWSTFPHESFLRYGPEKIAWQTASIVTISNKNLPLVVIKSDLTQDYTEIFVYSSDRDGLFATITSTLDRFQLDVQEARVINSSNGMSLDTFTVLNRYGNALDPALSKRLSETLQANLVRINPIFTPVKYLPLRKSHAFTIRTKIEFSQIGSIQRTQVALICTNRPGLLAVIAQVFRECRVRVHDARIATFGERVEDFFKSPTNSISL